MQEIQICLVATQNFYLRGFLKEKLDSRLLLRTSEETKDVKKSEGLGAVCSSNGDTQT